MTDQVDKRPHPAKGDYQTLKRLGLFKRCTCAEYAWETLCPYEADVFGDTKKCNCCPYHERECTDDI